MIQISNYTLQHFGERQRKKYLGLLRKHMRAAAANPQKGRDRSDINPGYYGVSAQKHRIYYRMGAAGIEIIDVLQWSMEPSLHV